MLAILIDIWNSVWIAAAGSGLLYGVFRAIEWRWPEKYLGMTATFGLAANETWWRFCLYRAVPIYLVTAATTITVDRVGGHSWVSLLVLLMFSIGLTHGRMFLGFMRSRAGEVNYAYYHGGIALLLSLVSLVAWLLRGWLSSLVPSPVSIIESAWGGLIVAALGAIVYGALRSRPSGAPVEGPAYWAERAERDLGIDMFDWAFKAAVLAGANPVTLTAFMISESIQRPRWTRSLERLLVRVRIAKTSGVMQVTSSVPLSDRESIQQAALEHASAYTFERYADGRVDVPWGEMWVSGTRHNPEAAYVERAREIARWLLRHENIIAFSEAALPGSLERGLVILGTRRYAGRIGLRYATCRDHVVLAAYLNGEPCDLKSASRPAGTAGPWWAAETDFDPRANELRLSTSEGVRRISLHEGSVAWYISPDDPGKGAE